MKKILNLIFTLIIYCAATAQNNNNVSGSVSSSNGDLLPGANVMLKGTTNGVVTDFNGEFTIQIADTQNAILVVSYIGFNTLEFPLNGKTNVQIVLDEDVSSLDEVVVVGYGTQKRSEVTTAISSISEKDFTKGAVQNPIQLIQGRVAGLTINTTSGNPGNNDVQLLLRGSSTFSGNQSPLIVIDGIIGGSLDLVNFNDVEKIDVLKDGSAAAIYGTRGTNGVILITTKKAKGNQKARIEYDGFLTVSQISRDVEVFSPSEYRKLPEITDGYFTIVDNGADTDWGDLVMRDAFSQVHALSMSGKLNNTSYIASLNYRDTEGIVKKTGSERLNVRLGVNQSLLDDLVIASLNISSTQVNENPSEHGQNVYFSTRVLNPTYPVKNPDGTYTRFPEAINPVQEINETYRKAEWIQKRIDGSVQIKPVDGLNIKFLGSIQNRYRLGGSYANKNSLNGSTFNGEAWRNSSKYTESLFESTVTYNWKIQENHDFTLLGGYNYQNFDGEGFDVYNFNFPTDIFGYNRLDLGLALPEGKANMGSFKWNSKLIAFFGRINYNYANKYFLSASIRQEGSTKFGENNKWGTFPSFSAGWQIANEEFLESVTAINELKLRAGYGVTGTEPTQPYISQLRYDYTSAVVDPDGNIVYAVEPAVNANPNLKWETKREVNLGLDFTLFDHRLRGSIDLYNRNTKDLISNFNVPVPPNLAPTIVANVGEVSNKGLEFVASGDIIRNDAFNLNLTLNYATNKNTVEKLSNDTYQRDFMDAGWTGAPVQKTTHRIVEGGSIGNFYGWKSTGLDADGKWIIEAPDGSVGEYGNEDHRQVIGNALPKHTGAFIVSGNYKAFDFSFSLRGAFKYQILNQHRMLWENFTKGQQWNFPTSVLDKPYGSTSYLNDAPAYVSYYVENGDFVKLDNVSIGYNIDVEPFKNIDKLRIYVSGANLHTFTKYKGVDPEVPLYGLSPGIDYQSRYPTTRNFNLGIQLAF
ncbi:SusC/RagA family TonB-linked outer membrane protein [Robertkochia solimangrovi]|uniref:SusC/RagA family TonB-linked outer membrane protein n=1 Tax=Robertkochia solimangrovi TaxID=2213046 RepID=UPI00117C7450|nr:SusC/RagA family TonB-linked outer membrane protein [Robertkochia solimangrovi]TRZ42230.1 SusC/RagA family TonB-linked outer membrane protein [Robertkochia solimangrovi]